MRKQNKKGFTIVELVIVIAVIAILVAVMVPTFVSLVKKAQVSNDKQLVKNLNTALKAESVTEKPATMTRALEIASDYGYDVAKIKAKAPSNNILWDSVNNVFCYLEDGNTKPTYIPDYPEATTPNKVDCWVIDSTPDANYSTYLYNYTGDGEIAVSTGIDVGNENISSIIYDTTATQTVTIRTNSFDTTVTVNTAGSVNHYGEVGKLVINKVAMSSFHEFGQARTVDIKEGNFVVEPKATVTLVSVKATEADKVKFDIQGTLDVVAGDTTKYSVTSTKKAEQTVNATIADNTLAIVDGVATNTLSSADVANKTVILLQDYENYEGTLELTGTTIIGNMTKLKAKVMSGDVTLKNIHTTNITFANGYNGTFTLDGGKLEKNAVGTNDAAAAIHVNSGYGTYVIKNMTVAANLTKGIKISSAKSVTIENCKFDASKLTAMQTGTPSDIRSLSLIDIQERNSDGKMAIKITGCNFVAAPQGAIYKDVDDSDTAGAIKIKSEKQGFTSVEITNNTFEDCYRDLVVGVNIMKSGTGFNTYKNPSLLKNVNNNVDNTDIWNISNNKSNATATKGVMIVCDGNSEGTNAYAEKLGELKGGCAVYNTYKSTVISGNETAWSSVEHLFG